METYSFGWDPLVHILGPAVALRGVKTLLLLSKGSMTQVLGISRHKTEYQGKISSCTFIMCTCRKASQNIRLKEGPAVYGLFDALSKRNRVELLGGGAAGCGRLRRGGVGL